MALLRSDSLSEVLAPHGVGVLIAFGSRVRGTDRAASDLDLGVLRSDGRALHHRELADLLVTLQALSDHAIDLVDLATADALLRYEAIQAYDLLYVECRDQWVNLVTKTLIEIDDLGPHLERMVQGVARRARTLG